MNRNEKNDIFSRSVRAGKRTYFFDVKATKNNENYLTITESVRKFDEAQNKFTYDKHKLFLYKEDFQKFKAALSGMLDYVEKGIMPDESLFHKEEFPKENIDISFDDLGDTQ